MLSLARPFGLQTGRQYNSRGALQCSSAPVWIDICDLQVYNQSHHRCSMVSNANCNYAEHTPNSPDSHQPCVQKRYHKLRAQQKEQEKCQSFLVDHARLQRPRSAPSPRPTLPARTPNRAAEKVWDSRTLFTGLSPQLFVPLTLRYPRLW